MPEYFDISLILKKGTTHKQDMRNFLKTNDLSEGENAVNFFNKQIIISSFSDKESNFFEILISFPAQVFRKDTFEDELDIFTVFLKQCFENLINLEYAICSYEMNGYLIGNIKLIEKFDDEFLKQFPISYKRNKKIVSLLLNLDAQDIFL